MAEPTPRLGRGLSALLGAPVAATAPVGDAPAARDVGMRNLEIGTISPNRHQPRKRFDPDALDALATSIRESGLMQPIVVRALPDGFHEIIAGERRWQAARRAGLTHVPAVVRDADERERLELALVENVVREDLNAMELARAVAALVEDFGQTHEQVATRLGRSRPAITNLLRLLELPDVVAALVEAGTLSEGHARAVLMADGARARRELAERVVSEGLSVRQTEAVARGSAPGSTRSRRGGSRPLPPVADLAIDGFYGAFEAPVTVRATGRGHLIVQLDFADEQALRRALERLS